MPFGIRASSNLYGIEGFHLKDVLGVVAASLPGIATGADHHVDIETRGELTRGMMVVDTRPQPAGAANTRVITDVSVGEVRQYIEQHPEGRSLRSDQAVVAEVAFGVECRHAAGARGVIACL